MTMIIRTTFKDNGIQCTLVSTEESISNDIKALVKAKLIKWHEEEPADKKAWKYRGYSMHWDKSRETWVVMKDGYEEWDAVTVGEVKEWIDGAKDDQRKEQKQETMSQFLGKRLLPPVGWR